MHPSRAYATTVTGLGRVLEEEARSLGIAPVERGNDGRADVIALGRFDTARARRLRTAENVLIDVADIPLRASARRTADQLSRGPLREALAAANLRASRVRLVVRLRDESHFTRTALRAAIASRLSGLVTANDRPAPELWVVQAHGARLWVGLRHPHLGTRAQPPRRVELPGALRPAVAAAMLRFLDGPGDILDPCCGTGTIAAEGLALGRWVVAGDLASAAAEAAQANVGAPILRLDARTLPFGADHFAAVVTNLPFGRQHLVQGAPVAWYRRALQEMVRVAPQAIVLAAPTVPFRQALGRLRVEVPDRLDLELLGNRTAIWVLRR